MSVEWTVRPGSALAPTELYELLALRIEVFTVEQNCPYQDLDNRDLGPGIFHVRGRVDGELAALIRVMYDGPADIVQIGRVVVREKYRSMGLGRRLMQAALEFVQEKQAEFPRTQAMLHGQAHLRKFYESLGFNVVGEEFLEDGIPHLEMIKQLDSKIVHH